MKNDWTKFAASDFSERKYQDLLNASGEQLRNEDFWQKFFWYFQMGTTSNVSTQQSCKIYEMTYQFLIQPNHMRYLRQLKNVELRLKIVRRFPFLAFYNSRKIGRRIWRKLQAH